MKIYKQLNEEEWALTRAKLYSEATYFKSVLKCGDSDGFAQKVEYIEIE